MTTRRTLRRQLADLRQGYDQAVAEGERARADRDTSRDAQVDRLTRELDAAKRLLTRAEDEVADLRKRLADRPTPGEELRRARREADLLRRQAIGLTARLEDLQTANEAAYREGAFAGPGVTE